MFAKIRGAVKTNLYSSRTQCYLICLRINARQCRGLGVQLPCSPRGMSPTGGAVWPAVDSTHYHTETPPHTIEYLKTVALLFSDTLSLQLKCTLEFEDCLLDNPDRISSRHFQKQHATMSPDTGIRSEAWQPGKPQTESELRIWLKRLRDAARGRWTLPLSCRTVAVHWLKQHLMSCYHF